MLEEAHRLLERAGRPRICVVGDLMLDTYVWGDVARISPEGPIPVLRVERREHRPGGAGSVAAMLAALDAEVLPVGIVGADAAGQALSACLAEAGVGTGALVRSAERPTTTKARYLGYVQSAGRALQQIVRVDEEVTDPLSPAEAAAVRNAAVDAVGRADLVVIEDMGKGLLDAELIREIIAEAARRGKPVVVDPERAEDYSPYKGAAAVLPNRFETELATGLSLRTEEDYARAARALLDELALGCVVVKLDREGMYLATAAGEQARIANREREVADVTGAGDMVTTAFGFGLACGASERLAAVLANFAAGVEVTMHGATPLPRAHLMEALRAEADPTARKIKGREEMVALRAALRKAGRKVAFTNGCFDLLHLGHVQLMRYARAQGDVLVVGLNTDASVRRLKGPGRPVNSQQVRSHVLASLADVDYVVLFDEESVLPLIDQLRPDVLVKGGDYTVEGVVGHELVQSYGGEVKLAPQAEGFSTTDLIRRIGENHAGTDRSNPS
jgi:D-beta-D-heptose 7-phosphate kinase/D-beta-D-heptose 1-phosphate adenosyltransferase